MSRDERPEQAEIDRLARAWAEADARDAALDSEGGTVQADRVWSVAAGEASDEEVRALALAAADDPQISLAWRLARELGAGADPDEAPQRPLATRAPTGPVRRGHSSWRAWPIAAALAATLVVVVGLRLISPEPPPAWRDGTATDSLVAPSEDGATRLRGAFELRWRVSDPVTRYTVRVTTGDLRLVYEVSDLGASHVTVPEAALAAWPAGTTLYWQVEARDPDGHLRASPAVRVVLAD